MGNPGVGIDSSRRPKLKPGGMDMDATAPVLFLNENNKVVRKGGVRYTMKDGIVYDAKQLLAEVKKMVTEAKVNYGPLKQPGM